jgi:heterodisulfide reductase subunit D
MMDKLTVDQFERDLWVCAQCGYCKAVCEVAKEKRWESFGPRGRIYLLRAMQRGEIVLDAEQAKKFSDHVFKCTLCARCRSACPVDVDTRGLQIALRKSLVDAGQYPENLNLMVDSMNQENNPLNYPNDERAAFVEYFDDPPDDLYQKEQAEVVYFVGCISSFSPAVQSVPEAFISVLEKADVNFSIMGEDEWCCGYPLIAAGMKERAESLKAHNIERVKQLGAHTVVTNCPSCYNTWAFEYDTDLEILHSTQYIKRLIAEKKIALNPLAGTAAYHDPCDLGRNSNVYEEPREVIAATGLNLMEFPENRERGYCCGGGGDLEAIDADSAHQFSEALAGIVQEAGVSEFITACQQCKRMMLSVFKEKEMHVPVRDVIELVRDAMQ